MKVQFPALARRSLFKEAEAPEATKKPTAQSVPKKDPQKVVEKLRELVDTSPVATDCSNPDCPYRAIVEAQKAKHRARVKNWRKKP